MNRTTIRPRPDQYDRDEDLEQLQRDFMNSNQTSSASVSRKAPPSFTSGNKKPSLFAQRRAAAAATTTTSSIDSTINNTGNSIANLANDSASTSLSMPGLESVSSSMPELEQVSSSTIAQPTMNTTLEDIPQDDDDQAISYEPVLDPHPEPHVPATKKMLDLTSMLGSVLGQVTEHSVGTVTAPTLSTQQQGFPQPMHRSLFKMKKKSPLPTNAPSTSRLDDSLPTGHLDSVDQQQLDYQQENDRRIASMTEEEILAAREEILGSLSQASIDYLKGQHRSKQGKSSLDSSQDKRVDQVDSNNDTDDLLDMKNRYFADVPLEGEKLAWMDDRFKAQLNTEQDRTSKEEDDDGKVDPVYRQLRFDLQGRVVDPMETHQQQELYHHGDQPDQAGYTLAELFYLVRSQVPSQRALILNILTRILDQAKKDKVANKNILHIFRRRDVAAAIYFRSALDDRHLVVTISALQALLSLVTVDRVYENDDMSLVKFNTWLGHIAQPRFVTPQETTKKWVNKMKLAATGANPQDIKEDDAGLAERDTVDALIHMDILARLRYLMAVGSDLRASDSISMGRMVELLICMAEMKGESVCDQMMESGVLDLAFGWVDDQQQQTAGAFEHRLCVLRLMVVVIQGSKKVAMQLKDKVTLLTLPWLATSPVTHGDYQVQIESLKVLRVLSCYGFVVPTLQDLQETVMQWLTLAIDSNNNSSDIIKATDNTHRAATAIGLMEVLLHAAADPHKTVPAHSVNWHQPISFLPLVTLLLCTTKTSSTTTIGKNMLVECCLGYLATWTSYLDKFPPESQDTVEEIWNIMLELEQQQTNQHQQEDHSSYWILRYMQLWLYFTKWDRTSNNTPWITTSMMEHSRMHWKSLHYLVEQARAHGDFYGRMVYYHWHKIMANDANTVDGKVLDLVVSSLHGGVVEAWLARALLQTCILSGLKEGGGNLEPFYMNQGIGYDGGQMKDVRLSKELMELNGQDISTLYYPQRSAAGTSSSIDAWLLSPLDEIYYWDKSLVTQQLLQKQQADGSAQDTTISTIITKVAIDTLQAVWQLYSHRLDHGIVLVNLMKIFLVGDREGQKVDGDATAIRELFWDETLSNWIDKWMDLLQEQDNKAPSIHGLDCLEKAWITSSDYTRQAHVPFYQFYQSFLSQYASVSLGHRVYSRVLAFVGKKLLDQVDYRHLLLSDYHSILITLERQGYPITWSPSEEK
ncbi:hypothetical protein BC941DRAFT_421862, partial [Chlamydoabsidia padenii]